MNDYIIRATYNIFNLTDEKLNRIINKYHIKGLKNILINKLTGEIIESDNLTDIIELIEDITEQEQDTKKLDLSIYRNSTNKLYIIKEFNIER